MFAPSKQPANQPLELSLHWPKDQTLCWSQIIEDLIKRSVCSGSKLWVEICMQEVSWGMFSGTTPGKKGGKSDWTDRTGEQWCSYNTNLRRCHRGRYICLELKQRSQTLNLCTGQAWMEPSPDNPGRGSTLSREGLSCELLVSQWVRTTHRSIHYSRWRSWDFFLRTKRSYWRVSGGGLARSDSCCLKITPAVWWSGSGQGWQ